MRELNTLHLNRITLNSGYIFVEDLNKAKRLRELFDNNHIAYSVYVNKNTTKRYYGFKVFRIKRKLIELCTVIKEAIEC